MSSEKDAPAPPPAPRRRRWRRYALELLVVLAVVAGVRAWQQRELPAGMAGALAGPSLGGQPLALDALRGRPVLVHFWATWCPVCKLEQGSIDAIARDYAVISVAMQSGSSTEVAAHLARYGLAFPVVNDPDGILSRRWRVSGVPTSFVVAPDGRIRFTEVGYTTEWGLRLRLRLAGLLAAAPSAAAVAGHAPP
jgi:thiol-disulfide isomerase/thioredoxin